MHDDTPVLWSAGQGRGHRAQPFDWFRDEVIVDFPSLGAAAGRMCDAFLAADAEAAPVVAEVRLSPREAHAGRRVGLDLALRVTCAVCGGRGEVWGESCRHCDGSGDGVERRQVHVRVPSGVRDGARFLFNVTPPHAPATVVDLRVSVG